VRVASFVALPSLPEQTKARENTLNTGIRTLDSMSTLSSAHLNLSSIYVFGRGKYVFHPKNYINGREKYLFLPVIYINGREK